MPSAATHLLIDFFGTMVEFSDHPKARPQGFAQCHALASSTGARLSYEEFLRLWRATTADLDRQSAEDLREFSIEQVAAAFLAEHLDRVPRGDETAQLAAAYIAEWSTGITYPSGTRDAIASLACRYRLAVVSNTHDDALVPEHLRRMEIADHFDAVVLSTVVGHRKPHPSIFAAALDELGIEAGDALFIGDSYDADYLGARAVGMRALLIDPEHRHPVAPGERLESLLEFAG